MVARKVVRAIRVIENFFARKFCKLKDVRIILGKLNDFAQMHLFVNGFASASRNCWRNL
jgi:hypothetical protein